MCDIDKEELLRSIWREKNREYYKKNRDKLLVKVKCECGKYVCKLNMFNHKKSKAHNLLMQIPEENRPKLYYNSCEPH